jgi:hypothetical protein
MRDGVSRGYESMMKFVVHKPIKTKWTFEKETENKEVETASPRRKGRSSISTCIHSLPSKLLNPKPKKPQRSSSASFPALSWPTQFVGSGMI